MEICYINSRTLLEIQIQSLTFSNDLLTVLKGRVYLNIMKQTVCLVFNPIMIEIYAALFSCTAMVQASDSMMAPT